METHRAENSEQKPSAFESPARLAGGAPRTSALGLGDTPSSHTSPADPGARRTRGWCFQSCSLLSRRAGARDPPAVRAIQSHRLGGKKNRSGARDRRPGRQTPGRGWCPGVPGLGEGGRKPLKPDTSRQGKLRRLVSWGGQPGCYCWNVFPPTRGVCRAARLRKGSETWMGRCRPAARDPGSGAGFGV